VTTFRVGDRVRYRIHEGVVTAVPKSGYVAARFESFFGDGAFHLSIRPDALTLVSRPSSSIPEEARPMLVAAMAGGRTRG
jgi:hypothetical protein